MDKKNKNPLLAGLMNVLIPGSSQLYVNKDAGKFIRGFIVGGIALTVAVLLGSLVQNARGYTLPQGACMGPMVLVVVIVLFINGRKVAGERNRESVDADYYNSRRRDAGKSGKAKQENEDKNEEAESKRKS